MKILSVLAVFGILTGSIMAAHAAAHPADLTPEAKHDLRGLSQRVYIMGAMAHHSLKTAVDFKANLEPESYESTRQKVCYVMGKLSVTASALFMQAIRHQSELRDVEVVVQDKKTNLLQAILDAPTNSDATTFDAYCHSGDTTYLGDIKKGDDQAALKALKYFEDLGRVVAEML